MKLFRLAMPTLIILLFAETGFSSGESGGFQPLPSVWSLIFGHEGPAYFFVDIVYGLATSILFSITAVIVYRKRQMIPGKLQNLLELFVESAYNFIESILGHNAKKYTPFLGTLFFYILINNMWGLIPGGHSPSTNISITASLAIMVFIYSQYIGFTKLGVVKYFDHLCGQPRDIMGWALVPLLLPIHLITEIAKPFTLALRLFGNIMGEDILVAAFAGLGLLMLSFMHSPVGVPLNVPFIFLGILLSTIQALVFAMLATIYFLLMLPHEEGH